MNQKQLYRFLLIGCAAGYLWVLYNLIERTSSALPEITPCPMKHITGLPCPSCGVTRSIVLLAQGDIGAAVFYNPLGILLGILLLIIPLWILIDYLTKRDSLLRVWHASEKIILKPVVYIPLILLVLVNWIWSITKGL